MNGTTGVTSGSLRVADRWLRATEEWDLIPREERDTLLTTVAEAVDLQAAGETEAGHAVLSFGLQRAEDHWRGNPWGRELVRLYQEALDRYTRRFEGSPPAEAPRDAEVAG